MKFDIIIGNPPYSGNLHQKIFNIAFDLLIDNGTLVFIQPSEQYINKKKNNRTKPEKLMLEIISENKTTVIFKDPKVFINAAINKLLVITVLNKVLSDNKFEYVKYDNDEIFYDVKLEHVNIFALSPNVYESIKQKYENYIYINGSITELVTYDKTAYKANLCCFRGHGAKHSDFLTLISKKHDKYFNPEHPYGIKVNNENEVNNVYEYLKGNIARFGLGLLKYNHHVDEAELKLIPKIDFTESYDEDKLFKMIGLTEEERKVINSLPDYYNRG